MKDRRFYYVQDESEVSPARIAVCVVRIRDLHSMLHDFDANVYLPKVLSAFFRSTNESLEQAESNIPHDTLAGKRLRDAFQTRSLKSLGDGLMIVWEYPLAPEGKVSLSMGILITDFLGYLQHGFYSSVEALSENGKCPSLKTLTLTIGVSLGMGLRTFGLGDEEDHYYGNAVEQAIELERSDLNEGILANLKIAESHLRERYCFDFKDEIINDVLVANKYINVWRSSRRCIAWRLPKWIRENNTERETLSPLLYDLNFTSKLRPLTTTDLDSIFEIRINIESSCAIELAKRFFKHTITQEEIDRLSKIVHNLSAIASPIPTADEHIQAVEATLAKEFHTLIAELSDPDGEKGSRTLVERLYESTWKLLSFVDLDIKTCIVNQHHAEIWYFIQRGDFEYAGDRMGKHIHYHYEEARKASRT